jgi:hypothetical protein
VYLICVQRCRSIVTVVTVGCGPMASRGLGGDMGARPVSISQELHILGPMRALVSPSGSILVSLPLCFKLEHFIIYVSLL